MASLSLQGHLRWLQSQLGPGPLQVSRGLWAAEVMDWGMEARPYLIFPVALLFATYLNVFFGWHSPKP